MPKESVKGKKKNTEETSSPPEVYEISFLLIPSLSESDVEVEVSKIRDVVEKSGGSIISDGSPKIRTLSYIMEMPHIIPKQKYDHAYFGWIKFESSRSTPDDIKKALFRSESVIRYIIVKTVKENTLFSSKVLRKEKDEDDKKKKSDKPVQESPKKDISDEEIDKSIEELIAE